jgi:nitroreductase
MLDALTLLKTRKSVISNFLAPPGPTEAELAEMLSIAVHVPDHGKLAPWRFIVLSGDARREAGEMIAALFTAKNPEAPAAKVEEERTRLLAAPLIVIVVSTAAPHVKIPEWEQVLSAGNVALSLVFAAHAFGYAAQWRTGFMAYDGDARRALGVRDSERIVAVIHIGTPTVPRVDRPRPDANDLVTRWTPPPRS